MQKRINQQHMREGGVTITDPTSTFIDATVTIGQDTTIEPFSIIKGNTEIGQECRIGPHVYIEDAKIGDRSDCGPFAKLRPGTEIRRTSTSAPSPSWSEARWDEGARPPCVLPGRHRPGRGRQHRRRHDHCQLRRPEQEPNMIGDGAFVGVDTMLVAPVTLGKGSRTGAGSVVTKDVPGRRDSRRSSS